MKKILGILVVAMLCVCMLVPTASAALSDVELEEIAEGVGLEDLEEMEAALDKYLSGDADVADKTDDTAVTTTTKVAAVPSFLDLSWLTGVLSTDTSAFTEMLSGFDAANLDSLLAVVSQAISGAGVDLANFDISTLGSFDITSILSNTAVLSGGDTQDMAATVTNLTAGAAETLKSGLTALGLDTATIEGILDNDIVNFFANMYIGFIGEVEETTEATTKETTTKKVTTTKKPAVVTTKTPKTGDTSAVAVAIATLAVASGAAFICLKKKEN